MGGFDRERAIHLILNGVAVPLALELARQASDDGPMTRWIVAPTGGLGSTPDPACVAQHLQGIARPTRRDVEDALDRCSR